jgi:hypothetical protein
MKRNLKPCLILSFFFSTATLASTQTQKLALLVGIDHYEAVKDKKNLEVCNGIPLMRQTLISKGFPEANILVLTDAQASRQGIRNAIRSHLGQAKAGDMVMFHFTGHGVQIPDDNKDEIDKLDEAIVPADGNLMRDDELSELFGEIRRRAGPSGQVLVVLDACHSGSGMRGQSNSRKTDNSSLREIKTRAGEKDLAPLIAFFSCQPQERSLQVRAEDNKNYGPLTYAFCRSMQLAGPQTSYRGLFDKICWTVAANSTKFNPQAEGDLDQLLFGGRVNAPPPYFKTYTVINGQQARIHGGWLSGLSPGTEVALYPIDTRDTAGLPPLAMGFVAEKNASLTECDIQLSQILPFDQLEQAWIFIRRRSFSGYDVSVRLDISGMEVKQAVQAKLATLRAIHQVADGPSELLLRQTPKKKLQLLSADSTLLFETLLSGHKLEQSLDGLRDAIGNYAQAQFLRSLEFEGSPYAMGFSITAPAVLRANRDSARITITNTSTENLYFNILDIDGSNKVTVLIPGEKWLAGDLVLQPGQTIQYTIESFNTPGKEVLKLISTPTLLDLRGAVKSRGRGKPGRSFMENLFQDTYIIEQRTRGPVLKYKGNEAGVSTVVLEVVKQ